MTAAGWRSWKEVVADLKEQKAATLSAFKVMTRMLNVQLGRGWARWRARVDDARAATALCCRAPRGWTATQLSLIHI